LIPIDQCCYKK